MLSAVLATVAGVLFALFNRYVNPENTLNFELMVFILLMCVIGGMGTLYGSVVGTVLFLLAQNYLQDVLGAISGQFPAGSLWAEFVSPGRWLLWFGLRSEEHTSELQSLMRISYAVFCLKKKKQSTYLM